MGKLKFNKRSLKYGSNSLILIAVVVAIAVVINLLVGMGDIKLDLTSDQIYSLSSSSKTILKDIKKDVTIYGLFDDGTMPAGSEYKDLINLLNQYKQLGFKVTYIDPNKDPGTLTSLDPDKTKGIAMGDFVVKCGNKVKKLAAQDLYGSDTQYGRLYQAEPLITGAIKFVASDVTPMAYFVEGHGEYSITKDMTQMKSALENNNFEVKPLSLLSEDKIPDDCKLLVFASPKKDLSEAEKIKVDAYLKKNGRAVFLLGATESKDKLANFEEILSGYNIGIGYDKVKETDTSKCLPNDEYSIIATLENNDVNNTVLVGSSGVEVFLPDSRSLSILKNAKEWLTTTSLIKTSDKAVAVNILDQSTQQGAFDLAVSSEISGGSKVLAFGNGIFLTDSALSSQYSSSFQNGATYFLSAVVNWTQDKSNEATVSPKLISQKELTTTAGQTKTISILLIGVLPILIMACGLIVWARRRHL